MNSFGNHHNGEFFACIIPVLKFFTDPLHGKVHFGDQDLICPSGNACHDGNPPDIAPHDFNNDNPVVRLSGCMEPVNRFSYGRDSGIKSERHICSADIIVDSLGNAHHRNSLLCNIACSRKRPVTTNNYQRMNTIFFYVVFDLLEIRCIF